MGKQRSLKLFGRVLEFKLKKKDDKGRIKFLVIRLMKELESQGHDLTGTSDNVKHITLFEHQNAFSISGIKFNVQIQKEVVKDE
jgi:hypothetical protein